MSSKKSSSSGSKSSSSKDKKSSKKTSSSSKEGTCARTVSLIASSKNYDQAATVLGQIRLNVAGDGNNEPSQASVLAVANESVSCDFFPQIVLNIGKLNSDARRDIGTIFNKLLKFPQVVEYLTSQRPLFLSLVESYGDSTLSLPISLVFAEILRYEPLCKIMLDQATFFPFFNLIQSDNFDVATNSFGTFKDLLTKHKAIVALFLEANYVAVFEAYTKLLTSENYVTKRTSLKLLGELLLDRSNFHVMTKYISEASNLKLMLTLLRDPSRNIQFEAFHVFKVFVANPKKPEKILDILVRNKEKLIQYLSDFHNDRSEDEQFMEERAYLIRQIQQL